MYGFSFFRMVTLKVVGIPGGNTQTVIAFNNTNTADLRFARIQAMEVYWENDMSHAQPENTPVISDIISNKMSLVFETNDPDDTTKAKGKDGRFTGTSQTQKWIPANALHRMQSTNGAPFVRQLMLFKDLYVTWEKSFLQIAPGGLNNTTDLAFCLGVYYTFLNTEGKPIPRT
jgi:hypothetical protein